MIDSARSTASTSQTHHTAGHSPPPAAPETRAFVDAGKQAGVLNPHELAKDLARVHAHDPQRAAALHAEIAPALSARDRQSLDDHLAAELGAVAAENAAAAAARPGATPRATDPADPNSTAPSGAAANSTQRSAPVSPVAGGTTPQFPSADAAAHNALLNANPASVRDNLEYGGLIFKDKATGQYSASAPLKGTDQGFNPGDVPVPKGVDVVGDYHTHGDYSSADAKGNAVRTSNPKTDAFNSDNFSRTDYRGITTDAAGKAEYTGYLGTPRGDFKRFDPATKAESLLKAPTIESTKPAAKPVPQEPGAPEAGKPVEPPAEPPGKQRVAGTVESGLRSTAGTAAGGAIVGSGAAAVLSTAKALADGRVTSAEAGDILANSAHGAVVGSTYAVTEQGFVKLADRALGNAVGNAGAVEAGALGAAGRTVAARLGGAGAAGAVISAGISAYENRDGLIKGDSQAIGNVAGDVAVGATAALSGAAAGAAIGSVVPVLGTAVGAVVGLGVGVAADYVMRAGGVDKAVGNAVTGGVDALKSAGKTVAGWFGW